MAAILSLQNYDSDSEDSEKEEDEKSIDPQRKAEYTSHLKPVRKPRPLAGSGAR
jgi:hypothetical protein